MSGNLRGDLFEWLREWEERADLVLVLGTSLSGMNADRMVLLISLNVSTCDWTETYRSVMILICKIN
jgi:hypothetical protein